jgi:hypothetical protein
MADINEFIPYQYISLSIHESPDLHYRDGQPLFPLLRKESSGQFHAPPGVVGVAIRADVMGILLIHRRTPDYHLHPEIVGANIAKTLTQSDARGEIFIVFNGKDTPRCPGTLPPTQDQANQTSFAISARQLLRSPLTFVCVPTAWVRAIAEVRSA